MQNVSLQTAVDNASLGWKPEMLKVINKIDEIH
jgi:hypothetical protein